MVNYIVMYGVDKVCVLCMYCGFNYVQIRSNLSWLLELHKLNCEREPQVKIGDRKWDPCYVECTGGSPLKESE